MVITSSTRNRVGGNTPRGFESHLLRQNKDHPSGWSLFFTPKVGFERRLLETCQWHVSTAVGARRPTTSKIFNGCLPQKRNPTFSAGRAGGIQTHLKKIPQSTKFFLRAANFLSCKSPQKPRKSSIFHRFYRQFTVFENFSNFFAIFVDKGGYPCYNISCR